MRSRMLVAAGLAAGLVTSTALAEDGYRHGRVFFIEPGVTLQRATEVSAEEAQANLPFLPGDRVWTDSAGRAEFQFPDGSVVRLDRRSKLDYSGHEEGEDERVVLRLWSGSTLVRVRTQDFARFEVETPAGTVQALDRGMLRVDVEAGETRVSVYAGEAVLDDGRRRVRLAAGERTFARWGAQAEEPRRFDPAGEDDDFARWDGMRESEERWAARSSEYLPDELDAYAGEFERNGQWQYEGAVGNVWVPRVEVGWQPYSNGRWAWTPYGYTWVPYERWGWAPSHYGRWGLSASFGWYWVPGRTWGPGWVSWAVGGGYVGWCPLGWRDQPVRPWGHHSGYAGSRGRYGQQDPWHVVRHGDLGGLDVSRRRVGFDRIDPGALRAADSVALRPTRDARSLRAGDAAPRAISRRQTPGDFVRELGVDNKTTIPAPWTRGYGPPPAGVDGARYGAQRRSDGEENRNSRTNAPTSGPGGRSEGRAAEPRPSQRTAPWYTPRSTESASGERGTAARPAPSAGAESRRPGSASGARGREEPSARVERRERTERSQPSSGARRPSGGESSSAYRPRSGGESSSGARRPSGGEGSSVYRPRSGGEGSSSARRPSEGESSSGYRPRSGGESASRSQPRSGGESSSRSQPRSGGEGSSGYRSRGGGDNSGGSQPRAQRSAPRPPRNEGGGSQARPSGGGSSGSRSSGQAAARPRGNRH